MSGYNNQHFGQANPNPNANYRPQLGNMNSSPNLASIQAFPPQTNVNYPPQQMNELQMRQQQALFAHQQQQAQRSQGFQPNTYGGPAGSNGMSTMNQLRPQYDSNNSQQAHPDAHQQSIARAQRIQQAQYLQAAHHMRNQAQAHAQSQQQNMQQRPPQQSRSPMLIPIPIQAAAQQAMHRTNSTSQHPHPPPQGMDMGMQRTLSNQSNGQRPYVPISGYQPVMNQHAASNPFSSNIPPSIQNSRNVNSSSVATSQPPIIRRPSADRRSPSPAAFKSTSDAPRPAKKRKNNDQESRAGTPPIVSNTTFTESIGSNKPRPSPSKPPQPIVYFNGVEKVKESSAPPVERKEVMMERPRAQGSMLAIGNSGANLGPMTVNAPAPPVNAPVVTERRRGGNGEGMRGSMRNEIARIMYAAGDVPEPMVESVDYVEDLLVEFLSDLCRPTPPVRSYPGALHTAPPLTTALIRHRLALPSRPSTQKYLARFDYMQAMDTEIARQRRAHEPTHDDLVNTVGRDYLELDESGAGAGNAGKKDGGVAAKKGRPKKTADAQSGATGVVERRKPGPKKGWKMGAGGVVDKKRGPYKKRAGREGSGVGVKGE